MLVRLASGSPRRLELLRQIGLKVDVYTSAFDEVSGCLLYTSPSPRDRG